MNNINVPSTSVKSDIELLEDLVLDNDLERLEGITAGFNIFESIGTVRREVRHSDFLSFLLTPSETHGLYDKYVKSLLFSLIKKNRSISELTAIDIDLLDLSDIDVKREWKNIDILLLSDKERFVCAIENKIDSSEHSNQLERYEKIIETEFSDYKKLFVFLTVEGDSPEKDIRWLPYSYQDIYEVTNSILKESEGKIGEDIYTLLKHYAEIINRHFMSDNKIEELSKKLYQKHKRALDLIFEHKPDALTETNKFLDNYLRQVCQDKITMDHCSKSYIRFAVENWDQVNGQLSGDSQWTKSNRVLLFEIVNQASEIAIKLIIGPGDKDFRENVFTAVQGKSDLFKGKSKSLYGKWTQIYKHKVVSKKQMEYDIEAIEKLIRQELEKFLYNGDFEKICSFFDHHFGIQE